MENGEARATLCAEVREITDAMEKTEEEVSGFEEVFRIIAEKVLGDELREYIELAMDYTNGCNEQEEFPQLRKALELLVMCSVGECHEKGEFLDFRAAWDRKEEREKRRVIEQETASRFRQCKARESAWAVRKRTGTRQREWRGPWREAKRMK